MKTKTAEATPHAARGRSKRGVAAWIVLAALTVTLLLTLVPFYLAILNAFKSAADYATNGPVGLPQGLSFKGITTFWENVDFGNKLINSLVISAAVSVGAVVLSLLNAYAIGIGRIRGHRVLLALFMIGLTLPQEALVYPLYYLSKEVGLYDTKTSIIIVLTVLQSAFGTYFVASVLSAFPRDVLEAAKIDGAGRLNILIHVVLPILRPTLMVLGTFFFIWTWNEFFLPLVMLVSDSNQTVTQAMGTLQGAMTSDPTTTAGAALLGMLPTLVFFLIFQRTLTQGITAGAIK
ncbi:carbohydrate ABC transporter permease [Arthrobacter sp. MI7-26]|uniref:carbohydrate ABC transporter permease n=1 Tax=Arthrobacter sp. MI7-26 TaxID=2993653 RepID=UPI00224953B5|nr:carbohydrate ABC transporter permease [Arthrobacter sp. MI7-26]MCX2748675.1 carbohydrate ABC transporter permease [Arthrobacter sp. MI7-26]